MMGQTPNRIEPAGPAGAYKTYQILSPHDRDVVTACKDSNCRAWRYGWVTEVDEATELGKQQAAYIRTKAGRIFTETRDGGLTLFRFGSKQRCFAEHRTRPELYLVRGGDWRKNLGVIAEHTRPADWVDDFGEHQQRLADQQKKG